MACRYDYDLVSAVCEKAGVCDPPGAASAASKEEEDDEDEL